MRRRNTFFLFLVAYFLIIFLWLAFCYRQVQKACISAGHSQGMVMEVISWPEDKEEKGAAGSGSDNRQGINGDSKYEAEFSLPFFAWLREIAGAVGNEGAGFGDGTAEAENDIGIGKEGEEGAGKDTLENGNAEEADRQGEGAEAGAATDSVDGISGSGENGASGKNDSSGQNGGSDEIGRKASGMVSETIRVVLTGDEGIYHKKAVLQAGGEELEIKPDSAFFADTDIIRVRLSDGEDGLLKVASLNKACGHPSYEGFLEIRKEGDKLVIINEVPLESYVEGVLPSEMPSSYPLEALKAQAVCARTYAEMKQENKAYPEYQAAVDDSTACQVYRNMEASEQGNRAVEETAGEALAREDGSYAECYYYSTSCGRSTTEAVWHGGEDGSSAITKTEEEITLMNQDFFDFIRRKQDADIEAEEPFYRWDYRCEKADYGGIFERCRQRQSVNTNLVQVVLINDIKKNETENSIENEVEKSMKDIEITEKNLGKITGMDIAERQEGGVADCLRIFCEKGIVYVWGEYNIRYVLAQGGSVAKQDGTAFQVSELLPSAFLSLQSICNEKGNMVGYIAVGGGFGHGVGMSQNGAKQMAASGSGYQEILEAYYPEAQIMKYEKPRQGS